MIETNIRSSKLDDWYNDGCGYVYPNNFNPKDKEVIKAFGKRLKGLREECAKNPPENTQLRAYIRKWTLGEVGKCLGISAQGYRKYEKGELRKIPMHKMYELCEVYDATSHYLLGYSKGREYYIKLDEQCNPIIENGEYVNIPCYISYFSHIQNQDVNNYRRLISSSPTLYNILRKIINSPPDKQKEYEDMFVKLRELF